MGLWDKVKNVTHTAVNWVEGKPDHKPDPPKPAPAASTPLTDQQKQNMLQNMQTVGLPLTSNPQAVQQQVQQQQQKPPVGALPDIISAANQGAPKNGQTVTLPSGTTIHKDPVLLDNGLSGSKTTIGIPGIEKPIEKSPGLTISNQELGGLFKTDPTYTAEQRDRDWALVNGKPTGFIGPVSPSATQAAAARLNAHFNPGLLVDNPNHTTYLPTSEYNAVAIAKDLSLVNTTEEGLDPRSKTARDQALARLGKAAYMKVNQDTDQLYAQWSPLAPNCGTGASREQQIQLLVQNGMPGNRAPTYKEAAAYVQNQSILAAMRLQQAGIPLNADNAIGNHLGFYSPDPRIPMQAPVEPLTWTDVHDWWDRFKDHPSGYFKDLGSDLKNQLGHDFVVAGAVLQNTGAVLTMPLDAMGLPHVEMSDKHGSLGEVAIAALDLVTLGTGVGKIATTAAERIILAKIATSAAAKALAENATREEAIAAARSAVDSFRSLPAATQEKIGASLADQADGGAGLNHSPTGGPQPTLVVPGTGEPTLGSLPWNRGASNLPNLGQPLHDIPDLEGGITPHLPIGTSPTLVVPETAQDLIKIFTANRAPEDIVKSAVLVIDNAVESGLAGFAAEFPELETVLAMAGKGKAGLGEDLATGGLGGPKPRGTGGRPRGGGGGRGPGGSGPGGPPKPPKGGRGGSDDAPEPGEGGLGKNRDPDWPPPADQRPSDWPDYFWNNTYRDANTGRLRWEKQVEWPPGSGNQVTGFAQDPFSTSDLYYDAKAVRSESRKALTALSDDNEFVKAYGDVGESVRTARQSLKDEIGGYTNGDFAKLTGHDRDNAFSQLKDDNPLRADEIDALRERVDAFFVKENTFRKASEDLGEAGALAELNAEMGEKGALLSNARGPRRLDLIGALEGDGTGQLVVWDAKGGGAPNLGDGAMIKNLDDGPPTVKAREGSPEYLTDRLRLELEADPTLRDKIRALDRKNGWHLEADLDRALAGDTSGIEYKAIQTDKEGNIRFWDFESAPGRAHPNYEGPGGTDPTASGGPHIESINAPLNSDVSQTLSSTLKSLSLLIPPAMAFKLQPVPSPQATRPLALQISCAVPLSNYQNDAQKMLGYGALLLR